MGYFNINSEAKWRRNGAWHQKFPNAEDVIVQIQIIKFNDQIPNGVFTKEYLETGKVYKWKSKCMKNLVSNK